MKRVFHIIGYKSVWGILEGESYFSFVSAETAIGAENKARKNGLKFITHTEDWYRECRNKN